MADVPRWQICFRSVATTRFPILRRVARDSLPAFLALVAAIDTRRFEFVPRVEKIMKVPVAAVTRFISRQRFRATLSRSPLCKFFPSIGRAPFEKKRVYFISSHSARFLGSWLESLFGTRKSTIKRYTRNDCSALFLTGQRD